MKRKIGIIIVVMLVCFGNSLVFDFDNEVKAEFDSQLNNGIDEKYQLNYSYIWEQVVNLSNVIYDAYDDEDLKKGRSYGSKGEDFTIKQILLPEMNSTGLEDVHKEQIKHIDGIEKNYSSIINMTDFKLTINNASDKQYPYNNPVPKDELFVFGCGYPANDFSKLTKNYTFSNAKIIPNNMTDLWPFASTFNDYYLNITSYSIIKQVTPLIVGNATYIPENGSVPNLDDQFGKVFLIDDVEGCQNKIDNITTAEGCIIITSGGEVQYANVSNCVYSVAKINSTDSVALLEILGNFSSFVDNVGDNLTFTYNLSEGWLPSSDHIYIDRIPNHYELWNYTWITGPLLKIIQGNAPDAHIGHYIGCVKAKSVIWRELNKIRPFQKCRGIMLYDTYDRHYMVETGVYWKVPRPDDMDFEEKAKKGPALPVFTMNNSVGEFLKDNHEDTTLSGYADQEFLEETDEGPGVEAYNVIGNITIEESPNDAIAILSNRYDGMWGQTPSDSGVGGAIVLGIAKYFKEHNITPKYNLTFLFTTGEEFGFRGAYHYNDSHPNDNIKYWFILDQLAWKQQDTALCTYYKNADHNKIINEIMKNQTRYWERTGYNNETFNKNGAGSEQAVASSRTNCDSFCLIKDEDYRCDLWHRAGANYTDGDSLMNTDRNDVNVTAELVWNITKYFYVNPNCWLSNLVIDSHDSPDDGDGLDDYIRANFKINTAIPSDLIKFEVLLTEYINGEGTPEIIDSKDYNVSSQGIDESYTFYIPEDVSSGNYSLEFRLYNSTGRINQIVFGQNDYCYSSGESDVFRLYHPFGYTKVGSNIQSIGDRITGSVFTTHENGTADNITAHVYSPTCVPAKKSKCMIYRKSDSTLVGTTEEKAFGTAYGGDWITYDFEGIRPTIVKDTEYVLVCWAESSSTTINYDNGYPSRGRYDIDTYDEIPPNPANFNTESKLYSIYCSYSANQPNSTVTYYFIQYDFLEKWYSNPSYMVDRNLSNFAHTGIGGDVELLIENRCELDFNRAGKSIIKVELRAFGKHSGGQRDIILRPVFNGFIDGSNYNFETTTTSEWSTYFNITDDNSAPPNWTWDDIDNLDCDVEAENNFGFLSSVYCAKVEIRVTYISE